MKFKCIKLQDFMRYKGKVKIDFSTDPVNNATVILGDNTGGKTTLAQAFRWCLYEDVINTKHNKKKDVVLLNNEVVSSMTVNSPAKPVVVEITIEDGKREYVFNRKAEFRRKSVGPNDYSVSQLGDSQFTLQIREDGEMQDRIFNDIEKGNPVSTVVNSILPKSLSNYLFFDGERWNDEKNKSQDIQKSIETILGLSGVQAMMRHLKTDRFNVISVLKSHIKNNSEEMNRLTELVSKANREGQASNDEMIKLQEQISELEPIVNHLKEQLESNRSAEEDQNRLRRCKAERTRLETNQERYYTEFVNFFSTSARFFASGLLPEITEAIQSIDLEGKDIPGVTIDTVDYLIEHGECLCGAKAVPGSATLVALEKLKKLIPPETIGGAAGQLQEKIADWKNQSSTFVEDAESKAIIYRDGRDALDEKEDEVARLEKRIDRKLNLADVRKRYNELEQKIRNLHSRYSRAEGARNTSFSSRDGYQARIDELAKASDNNKEVLRAIAYAEAVYEKAANVIKEKEQYVFQDLNILIRDNFEKMFNGKEKYAKLEKDYRVHVYYHQLGQSRNYEETTLSNGEMIAINYVFIVSVLQLAKRYADEENAEEQEHKTDSIGVLLNTVKDSLQNADATGTLRLPLVLDAPFSNLSNANTGLVASRLPEFAEQVIIFMLDKDWKASGLSRYTKPEYCYRIKKDASSNSSYIIREGEV